MSSEPDHDLLREVERHVRLFLKNAFPGRAAEVDALSANDPLDSFIDSLRLVELVTYLEGIFRLTIPADDFVPWNLDTIDRIARLVARRTAR